MNFYQYQRMTDKSAVYADSGGFDDVMYLGLGLTSEAGEVADLLKRVHRDHVAVDRSKLCEELGDVLWYVAQLCRVYDFELEDVADANIAKLSERYGQ